jgi:hypothetical protein
MSPELVLCPNTTPANPAHRRTESIVVDHLDFIILPPEIVVAGFLLRLFHFNHDLRVAVTFLGHPKCRNSGQDKRLSFLHKKVRNHLAPKEEQSSRCLNGKKSCYSNEQRSAKLVEL